MTFWLILQSRVLMLYKTKWKMMLIVGALIAKFVRPVRMEYKIKMKKILIAVDLCVTLVYKRKHASMEYKIKTRKISTVEDPALPVTVDILYIIIANI